MAFASMNFFSKSLNRTVPFHIVIPTDKVVEGKQQPKRGPYKTLYLLHGLLGNYTDWINGTRVQAISDAYDLCVVMPSGDNKFYCDSDISGDYYGTFIGKELVAFTRDTFPLSRKREDTFIGGLSMGGFGAIVNGLRHPETFGYITAFSAALIKDQILHAVDEDSADYFTKTQYETMFNVKDVSQFEGSVNDYDALAQKLAKNGGVKPEIFLACGTQDPLMGVNKAFLKTLQALGYHVTWEEARGGHDWIFWDYIIEKAIAWLPLSTAVSGISSGNVAKAE